MRDQTADNQKKVDRRQRKVEAKIEMDDAKNEFDLEYSIERLTQIPSLYVA